MDSSRPDQLSELEEDEPLTAEERARIAEGMARFQAAQGVEVLEFPQRGSIGE